MISHIIRAVAARLCSRYFYWKYQEGDKGGLCSFSSSVVRRRRSEELEGWDNWQLVQGGEQSSRRQTQGGFWRWAVCVWYVYARVCACDVRGVCMCVCVVFVLGSGKEWRCCCLLLLQLPALSPVATLEEGMVATLPGEKRQVNG